MPNPKGNPENLQHKGREKGSKNKFTNLKNAFLEVYKNLGGAKGMLDWVQADRTGKRQGFFYQWMTKMLPTKISADIEETYRQIILIRAEQKDETKKPGALTRDAVTAGRFNLERSPNDN